MKSQRLAIGVTVINLMLLVFLVVQISRAGAHPVAPMLRARGLEIVDDRGNIRAEIMVVGPETVNGKVYPDRVLFRMADQNRRPIVKFTASADGSSLGMSDDTDGGMVHLNAKRDTGNFIKVVGKNAREQIIKP